MLDGEGYAHMWLSVFNLFLVIWDSNIKTALKKPRSQGEVDIK